MSQTDGKQPMNIRISAEGRRILDEMAREKGISRTAVIELALRHYEEEERRRKTTQQ